MNKSAYALLTVALLFGACKENTEKISPDLTTSLAGRYTVTYLITGSTTGSGLSGGPPATSFVDIQRKTNNTIAIGVTIKDGTVQIDDHFDAAVSLDDIANDGLLLPDLKSRYKVAINVNEGSSGMSHLNLYTDGKVRGGLAYSNSKKQIVSLYFVP